MSCNSLNANFTSSLNFSTLNTKTANYLEGSFLSLDTESIKHLTGLEAELNPPPISSPVTSSLLCQLSHPSLQGDLKASFSGRAVLTNLSLCYPNY